MQGEGGKKALFKKRVECKVLPLRRRVAAAAASLTGRDRLGGASCAGDGSRPRRVSQDVRQRWPGRFKKGEAD